MLRSPEKRCGKSTVLSITGALVNKPLIASSITTSSSFRMVDAYQCTLLVDELDTQLHGNNELRGFLNSAHRKETAAFIRSVSQSSDGDWMPVVYSSYAPIVLAMIGMPPATVSDRAIHVLMQRKDANQDVEPLSPTIKTDHYQIRQKIQRWIDDSSHLLNEYERFSVEGVGNDRAIDNFQPLLKVAKLMGVEVFEGIKGNIASYIDENSSIEEDDIPMRLLRDIREVLQNYSEKRIYSKDLVSMLLELDDGFWKTAENNRSLTAGAIAKHLSPFKVKSRQMRIGESGKKGFFVADFGQAFERYLEDSENVQ